MENLLGKTLKVSYHSYTGSDKTERYYIGKLLRIDENFIILEGLKDGQKKGINKEHVIEWTVVQ